jgi:malic enzyme
MFFSSSNLHLHRFSNFLSPSFFPFLSLLFSSFSYIFPAFGLASISVGAQTITDEDFIIAARKLADLVPEENYRVGCVYPSLDHIREVSLDLAAAVAKNIHDCGRSDFKTGEEGKDFNWVEHCRRFMYTPSY